MNPSYSWEQPLLSLANDTTQSSHSYAPVPHAHLGLYSCEALRRAYAHCAQITAQHSRSFFLASGLMPRTKRPGTRALYAFCRKTDDIVDRPSEGDPSRALQHWRTHALHAHPQINDLVVLAWRDTLHQHQIPVHYAHQLIDGVATDLHKNRYQTFEELSVYAYQVASTVGLMSMHITGFDSAEALPYAIKLGVALQMTNILRDVGEDARNGRVYLPQVELAHFGLTDADLQAGQITPAWRAFMRHQIARNRQLYQQALPGIAHLHADGQLAIAAAAVLYREILTEIEHNEYDVFSRRAFVSGKRKLVLLAKTWWQLRRHIPL